MGKDTKPVPRANTVPQPENDPFKQFLRDSLDRVTEEKLDVLEQGTRVREEDARIKANTDELGRPREPQPAPLFVVPPDPVTDEVMRRRFLPMAHLTGNQVDPVNVSSDANPLLVEAHKLIGDLLAGGMISVQSPLIWQRVKGTQEKLRVAISSPPVQEQN